MTQVPVLRRLHVWPFAWNSVTESSKSILIVLLSHRLSFRCIIVMHNSRDIEENSQHQLDFASHLLRFLRPWDASTVLTKFDAVQIFTQFLRNSTNNVLFSDLQPATGTSKRGEKILGSSFIMHSAAVLESLFCERKINVGYFLDRPRIYLNRL